MTAAPVAEPISDLDLLALLADLAAEDSAPCEAPKRRHGRSRCAGEASHRLQTCLVDELVCATVVERVRAAMGVGKRCREHGHPIAQKWRLIPI